MILGPPFRINVFQNGAQSGPKCAQNFPKGSLLQYQFWPGSLFLKTLCATPPLGRPYDDSVRFRTKNVIKNVKYARRLSGSHDLLGPGGAGGPLRPPPKTT